MLNREDWYAPWFNRTAWIFENIDALSLEPNEILTLLAINYLQETNQPVIAEQLALKTGLDPEAIDEAMSSLSDKGCMTIDTRNKQLTIMLDCLLDQAPAAGHPLEKTLLSSVQAEFGRTLSASELERLSQLCDTYEQSTILHALDESAVYNKRSIAYMEALLVNWKAKGLSAQDIEEGRR